MSPGLEFICALTALRFTSSTPFLVFIPSFVYFFWGGGGGGGGGVSVTKGQQYCWINGGWAGQMVCHMLNTLQLTKGGEGGFAVNLIVVW